MKRNRRALAGVAVVGMLFAACGGDDDDSPATDESTTDESGSNDSTDAGSSPALGAGGTGVLIVDGVELEAEVLFCQTGAAEVVEQGGGGMNLADLEVEATAPDGSVVTLEFTSFNADNELFAGDNISLYGDTINALGDTFPEGTVTVSDGSMRVQDLELRTMPPGEPIILSFDFSC